MHDVNKFEQQNRSRLREIYQSVRCPQEGCGVDVGMFCRNLGGTFGSLTSSMPRLEPHQIRKLVAIEQFMAAAGVGAPVPPKPEDVPAVVEPVKQTEIFDAQPAAWEASNEKVGSGEGAMVPVLQGGAEPATPSGDASTGQVDQVKDNIVRSDDAKDEGAA